MIKKISFLFAALFLAAAYGASAHSSLVSSKPAANQTVKQGRSDITLTFDTKVEKVMHLTVTNQKGNTFKTDEPAINKDTITIHTTKPLQTGDYKVTWEIIGGDGHEVKSSMSFKVGTGKTSNGQMKQTEKPKTQSSSMTTTEKKTEKDEKRDEPVFIVLIAGLAIVILTALFIIIKNKRK
ncbi:hypothetical protein EV207_108115 [Scopulibacillus darangshiensis]|uniref:CopC domain-containing protein n=1 Tax=Scopulibacillus darangshiensis TaxID=442528 RepID=A0A4R2P4Y3_9BACL|nr:copper resistance CopC family protein [Scopulibacillus darangshiensis]TCP29823.1 hypothetical protein EV207_108115 [Scopulibacillus darangshiensis]